MATGDAFQPQGNLTFVIGDVGTVFVSTTQVERRTKATLDKTGPTSAGNHEESTGNEITIVSLTGWHGEGAASAFSLFPTSLAGKTVEIFQNDGLKYTGTANIHNIIARSDWRRGEATYVSMQLVFTGAVTQEAAV